MPSNERPREKAIKFGIDKLSNQEVLALILGSGSKYNDVFKVADNLLMDAKGISNLLSYEIEDFKKIKGIKEAKALQLKACVELVKRMSVPNDTEVISISNPLILSNWLNNEIGYKKQENFIAVYLNTKNEIITYKILFIGSLNSSLVHPREIFKEAMRISTAKIIIAHNHPTGECTPSEQDIALTKNLCEIGKLMGIPIVEHIIVGKNNYFSFAQKFLIT
ncbi:MAG: DNA repair protein RadC [Erysipelotrichaceae bacterium]